MTGAVQEFFWRIGMRRTGNAVSSLRYWIWRGGARMTDPATASKLKKHLRELSAAVTEHLTAIDAEMRSPESRERGERIANLCNALDYANDRVRYFALGVNFRTDKKRAARVR